MENPIDVVVLDSLFNLALQQGGMINVHAALAYTAMMIKQYIVIRI